MSGQDYYRVELPTKYITIPGNMTESQAKAAIIRTFKDYVDEHLELISEEDEPEPEFRAEFSDG